MEEAKASHESRSGTHARDVATTFDERTLADCHTALHADQARLQADVDRLAAELEQARRPRWRSCATIAAKRCWTGYDRRSRYTS
jgi:hypothetical protein